MDQTAKQNTSFGRANLAKIVYLLCFAVFEVLLSTFLLVRGRFDRVHPEAFVSINGYASSLVDIWILGPIRSVLLLGAVFGVVYNWEDAVERIKSVSRVITQLALLMWSYPQVKMLIYTENAMDYEPSWFWPFFFWSEICAWVFLGNWTLLGTVVKTKTPARKKFATINASDEERQCLIDKEVSSESEKKDDSKDKKDGDKEEEPKKETSVRVKAWNVFRLLGQSKPDLAFLILAAVFMVASSVADVFSPLYTSLVIQAIAIEKLWDKCTYALIMMVVCECASTISAGLRSGLFTVAMARLNIRIRNKLFASIMRQELGFFDTHKTGEITSRLTSDATTMSDALSLNANIFLRSIIKTSGVCIFMFKLSWRLSMVTVVGLPIMMILSEVYGQFLRSITRKVQDALAKVNEVAEEACSSVKTVRSFAGEQLEVTRYSDMLKTVYALNIRESIAYSGYTWSTQLLSTGVLVATFYYGAHLVMNGMMEGGDLVSFLLYQMQLAFAFYMISNVYSGLMQAVGASEKVFEIIDREPLIKNDGQLAPATFQGKVEFRNVSFKYPSRSNEFVLKSVSLTIEPGEVVALVGPSGGGKSTSVGLIEHFYEPTEGAVLLDGVPVEQYSHSYLHSKIALVSQEPALFARSVEDNIAYGLPTYSKDDVTKAAQMANAHQFISEMSKKYETEAGEKGTHLSGGQKQRVAIARAIIRNPSLLILDEATSALDAESEFTVQEAIEKNLTNRTVIIIAHRLSTVERADRIIVIDHGAIAEQGTHAQLLRSGGLYSQLVKRQLLGQNIDSPEPPPPPPPMVIHNRTLSIDNGDSDTVPHSSQEPAVEPLISVLDEQEQPGSPLITVHCDLEQSRAPRVPYSQQQPSSPLVLIHNEQELPSFLPTSVQHEQEQLHCPQIIMHSSQEQPSVPLLSAPNQPESTVPRASIHYEREQSNASKAPDRQEPAASGEGSDNNDLVHVDCSSSLPDLALPVSLDSNHDSNSLASSVHSAGLSASSAGAIALSIGSKYPSATTHEIGNNNSALQMSPSTKRASGAQTPSSGDKGEYGESSGAYGGGVLVAQGTPDYTSTSPPLVLPLDTSSSPPLVRPGDTNNRHFMPRVMLAQNGQRHVSGNNTQPEDDEQSSHSTVT